MSIAGRHAYASADLETLAALRRIVDRLYFDDNHDHHQKALLTYLDDAIAELRELVNWFEKILEMGKANPELTLDEIVDALRTKEAADDER